MSDKPKPRYTQPCNNCGLCCRLQLCEMAKMTFPDAVAPCPALAILDDGQFCGLVAMERMTGMKPMIAESLGIGTGCSMPDEDTTDEEIDAFDTLSYKLVFGRAKPAHLL